MGLFTVHNQGGSIFFKSTKVTCILLYNKGGGSRRDLNHKFAYMYVHLLLSPPPPRPRRAQLIPKDSVNPIRAQLIPKMHNLSRK